MKIKWSTGWKLNGVRCCDEIQEHVYFLDWLVMICLHLFINCLHYILDPNYVLITFEPS